MKFKKYLNGFTIMVILICLITLILNKINGRFQLGDFKVYYTAAVNLITGKPVYLVSFYTGSGFYKYSPATLLLFVPYTIFNFNTAAVIHFTLLGATYIYTFFIIGKLIRVWFSKSGIDHLNRLLSVSFVCILLHFTREMYLGNINIILLMLMCLSLMKLLQEEDRWSGFFMGLAVLAKPYLLLLMIPLVLRKKMRALSALCMTIAGGLIMPFIYPGPVRGFGLYADWIKTILNHQDDFPGRTSLDYVAGLLFPSTTAWGYWLIPLLLIAIAIILIINNIKVEKQLQTDNSFRDMNIAFEFFLLLALIPNLIRSDWVILLFSAPLITFMVFYIAGSRRYGLIPLMILILFCYSANSDDLLGRQLSHTILESGLMGVSNFLLLVTAMVMFAGYRKKGL